MQQHKLCFLCETPLSTEILEEKHYRYHCSECDMCIEINAPSQAMAEDFYEALISDRFIKSDEKLSEDDFYEIKIFMTARMSNNRYKEQTSKFKVIYLKNIKSNEIQCSILDEEPLFTLTYDSKEEIKIWHISLSDLRSSNVGDVFKLDNNDNQDNKGVYYEQVVVTSKSTDHCTCVVKRFGSDEDEDKVIEFDL